MARVKVRESYGVAEVAGMLGVSRTHIRNEIKKGSLATFPLGDRVLIPRTELERLLASARRNQSVSEQSAN